MGNQATTGTGHRVLDVAPGSPGSEAHLVNYLDVIFAVNENQLVGLALNVFA